MFTFYRRKSDVGLWRLEDYRRTNLHKCDGEGELNQQHITNIITDGRCQQNFQQELNFLHSVHVNVRIWVLTFRSIEYFNRNKGIALINVYDQWVKNMLGDTKYVLKFSNKNEFYFQKKMMFFFSTQVFRWPL